MQQNLTSIQCTHRTTFGTILKNTQHEIYVLMLQYHVSLVWTRTLHLPTLPSRF